ncbi:hypothetical protein SLS62_006729 [Diatrype stigma]|uniref:CRIB domain-containing protein n=1 Tax=Diatrype stigma TaxID=117547 RepID=A0AAN9YMM2_9PEZI
MHSLNSAGKGGRRNAATENSTTIASPPISPRRTLHHAGRGRHDFLESTIDDPPSPDRLRADSRQARKGSVADKHSSQLTISSGSSWDNSIEEPPISRRSSQRSISSNIPLPQDRPDSLMVFGKSIFSRKGKGRRDISDPNPSTNSLNSPGVVTDPMPTPKEQRSMAALFSRRKSMKGTETMPAQQKKVQISEPYNFQHLTHTLKDNLPNLERTTRMDLVSEFSCIRAGQKPHGSLKGIQADDIQYQRLSSELYIEGFEPELDQAQLQQDLPNTHASYRDSFLPRIRPISSLEDTLLAPFTPPAGSGPALASAPTPAPAAPRVSGRKTTRLDNFELLPSADPDRLAPVPGPPRRQSEPHIHMTSRHTESPDPSCGVTALDDAAWPLSANAMASLPELPEEEEAHATAREPPSRPTHKRTSLRGSVSVPALHQFSMSQSPPAQVTSQRAPSDASDTLGEFDLVTIQQPRQASVANEQMFGESLCDNWEDDIDYCYDHAAEADCDFAWERASGEVQREIKWEKQPAVDYRISSINSPGCFSPDVLSPRTSQFPTNIRNPVPQVPNTTQPTSATPATAAAPVTSNFSLPQRAHNRALSRSDSFRERARGLSVSPTFLISPENPQQIPEDDGKEEPQPYDDDDDDSSDDEDFLTHLPSNGPGLQFDKKTILLHARSSASTDLSAYSEHSLSSSRHKSNASINTALTGWTTNSTCASLDGWQANWETSQPTSQPPIAVNDEDPTVMVKNEDSIVPSAESTRPTSRDRGGHERHRSDADLLSKACAAAAGTDIPPDTKEVPPKARRRARTTSRSHNSPQLALFPHVPSSTRRA